MITIKEALTKKEMKDYVMFSFELYKNNPYWIPPIIAEELETFDKTKNPALQTAEAHFYLAYKNGKIVGKVAAIINWEEVNLLEKRKVRFGWFDAIDDIEVTKALLSKVEELGKKHQMDHMEGPMGFSNLDKVGVLSEGFDKMFDLFNETYSKLQSFVPINDIQKNYFKKKYISFINPEFIKFIMDKNDNMIAFAIVMPGFAQALKKANGKLFPFGFYHLLQARKHSKEVVFYLIGVTPEYQSKGVTAIIFDEYYKVCQAKGIETCIRTPELEENHAIHNLWKNFNTRVNKRRRTYRKEL